MDAAHLPRNIDNQTTTQRDAGIWVKCIYTNTHQVIVVDFAIQYADLRGRIHAALFARPPSSTDADRVSMATLDEGGDRVVLDGQDALERAIGLYERLQRSFLHVFCHVPVDLLSALKQPDEKEVVSSDGWSDVDGGGGSLSSLEVSADVREDALEAVDFGESLARHLERLPAIIDEDEEEFIDDDDGKSDKEAVAEIRKRQDRLAPLEAKIDSLLKSKQQTPIAITPPPPVTQSVIQTEQNFSDDDAEEDSPEMAESMPVQSISSPPTPSLLPVPKHVVIQSGPPKLTANKTDMKIARRVQTPMQQSTKPVMTLPPINKQSTALTGHARFEMLRATKGSFTESPVTQRDTPASRSVPMERKIRDINPIPEEPDAQKRRPQSRHSTASERSAKTSQSSATQQSDRVTQQLERVILPPYSPASRGSQVKTQSTASSTMSAWSNSAVMPPVMSYYMPIGTSTVSTEYMVPIYYAEPQMADDGGSGGGGERSSMGESNGRTRRFRSHSFSTYSEILKRQQRS